MSEQAYEAIAVTERGHRWELHRGVPRDKPGTSFGHNDVAHELLWDLAERLDNTEYMVRINSSRVYYPTRNYYIPDLVVFSAVMAAKVRQPPYALEVYREPVPFIAEAWSPATTNYDDDEKLAIYRARGDLEAWHIHPYEQTITAWWRQPDGKYVETIHRDGTVPVASLPGVEIELAALFES